MKFSLKKKTILLIVCIAAIISLLAIVIYDKGIHDVIELQYEERSIEITKLVAAELDAGRLSNVQRAIREIYDQSDNKVLSDQWGTPEFEAYVAEFASIEDMDDYQTLRADLRRMQDVLDVNCLYIVWMDAENKCNVYLIDAAYEDPCPPGCIDPVYADVETLEHPEVGYAPNITNTPEYGWIVATGMPVFDEQGEVIAFAAVDISMNNIMALQNRFLLFAALAFLVLTILVSIAGIALVNRFIVKPINTLSQAATQYKNNRKVFSELKMSRNDEIGVLAESMTHMEEDINGYINNLEQTTNDLITAQERAEEMNRAANIDALTKVRNSRAFSIESKKLNEDGRPYGIMMIDLNGLKEINDTHGHEKGSISIKTVCRIICQVFAHSPVYRVGGDEFVVILQNNDYEERNQLIQSLSDAFRRNMEDDSLLPWERVTAAFGYAEYDPETDDGVSSVMKRADARMYENKKKMKATI
ncbi:MAG: diguanylate cyclase [Clostridia bacterium]|nr:diguanylate cyclase [Clostridia bacterium]